jgi:hypothetical protein
MKISAHIKAPFMTLQIMLVACQIWYHCRQYSSTEFHSGGIESRSIMIVRKREYNSMNMMMMWMRETRMTRIEMEDEGGGD